MHEISDDLAKSLHDTLIANAHFEVLDENLVPIKSKGFDLLIAKKVDISLLYASSLVEDYNNELIRLYGERFIKTRLLTEDEFKFLKRLL